jgi:dTDP-4-amino-4,6-dideoxygalactose transaminase
MDRQFLEFWGNYLLAAAKGQKQLEDLNRWIRRGCSGFEELTAMFKKYYGLQDPRRKDSAADQAWQNAAAEQEKTIQILRKLLAEEGTYQGETVKVFQDLVNKQAAAFETFMKNLTGGPANED